MRALSLKLLVLASGLVAALPSAALEVDGNVGAVYARSDSFAPDSTHANDARYTLSAGLNLRGFYYRPDTLEWKLGASWSRLTWRPAGGGSAFEQWLFYDARAAFLARASYPVSLTLDASRSHTEFSSGSDVKVSGDTVTRNLGGNLVLRLQDRPTASFGYHRYDTETNTPGIGVTDRKSDLINGSVATATTAYHLGANYTGVLSYGPYASDNIDQHSVNVTMASPITSNFEFMATDQYLATTPREFVPGSVRQETNAFRAYVSNRASAGELVSSAYTYAHTLTDFYGAQLQEGTYQSLLTVFDALLTDPKLYARWMLSGSLLQARSGPTELRTAGETAGALVGWSHATESRAYDLSGGPSVGLLQTEGGGNSGGWGIQGSGEVRFGWGAGTANVRYDTRYSTGLFGDPGWSLRQSVTGGIGGPVGYATVNASLSASGYRTQSPVFGVGVGRSVALVASAVAVDSTADLNLTLQEGIAGSSPSEIIGDGLFIPSPFDSRTFNATLRASTVLHPGLSAVGHLRYLATTYPAQPTINQYEALAGLRYAYGALTFGLEDRITRFEQANGWWTTNLALATVSRSVGWRSF